MSASWGRLLIAVLLLAVLGSALSVVNARHNSRKFFVALQASKAERDDLNIEFGQLQLEQSAWATHGRIERIARDKLKMRIPDQQSVVLIKQ